MALPCWGNLVLSSAFWPGRLVDTPEHIAEEGQRWVEAGVDGFNVVPVATLDAGTSGRPHHPSTASSRSGTNQVSRRSARPAAVRQC